MTRNKPPSISNRPTLPLKKRLSYQLLIDFIQTTQNDKTYYDELIKESYGDTESGDLLLERYSVLKWGKSIKSCIWDMVQYSEKYAWLTDDDRIKRKGIDDLDRNIIIKYGITRSIYIAYILKIEAFIKDSISDGIDWFKTISTKYTIERLTEMRKKRFQGEEDREIFDRVIYSGLKELYSSEKINHPIHQDYVAFVSKHLGSKVAKLLTQQ